MCAFVIMFMFCAGLGVGGAAIAFCLQTFGSAMTPTWRTQFEGTGFVDASCALSDLNDQGRLDVVATSFSHGWKLWDGKLGQIYLLNAATGKPRSGYVRNFRSPVVVGGIADFDNDGIKEILISKRDGSRKAGSLMILEPDQGLPVARTMETKDSYLEVQIINDLNGDGQLEIVALSRESGEHPDNTLYLLSNQLQILSRWHPGGRLDKAILSDLNADGVNDLIISHGDRISVLTPGPAKQGRNAESRCAVSTPPAALMNVAVQAAGGKAEASSYGTYMGHVRTADRAIDGRTHGTDDYVTGWSASRTPAWLQVTFDQEYPIEQIGLWFGSHKVTYSVSLSEDGRDWRTVVESTESRNSEGSPPTYESFTIEPLTARYVRVDITATSAPRSHIWQATIHELQAFTKQQGD